MRIVDSTLDCNVVADGEGRMVIQNSTLKDNLHAVGNSRVEMTKSKMQGKVATDPGATIIQEGGDRP